MNRWRVVSTLFSTEFRSLMGYGSVLGTDTLPHGLMRTIQNEIKQEEQRKHSGIGETLRNCIGHGEIDQLESPEADVAHLQKVELMVDNLFSKIPLPDDPMKVALAPTDEEKQKKEECEVLKEAVREIYLRQKALKTAEEARISIAMKCYEERDNMKPNFSSIEETEIPDESVKLRRQIEDMKRQVERLEKLLESKSH